MSNYIDFLCTLGVERITLEFKTKINCHLSLLFLFL